MSAGKGDNKVITIGDNRYGMPEVYDPTRNKQTLEYYKKGDSASKISTPTFNGIATDAGNNPRRKMNYGKVTNKYKKIK